jgi:hypothetical protein
MELSRAGLEFLPLSYPFLSRRSFVPMLSSTVLLTVSIQHLNIIYLYSPIDGDNPNSHQHPSLTVNSPPNQPPPPLSTSPATV